MTYGAKNDTVIKLLELFLEAFESATNRGGKWTEEVIANELDQENEEELFREKKEANERFFDILCTETESKFLKFAEELLEKVDEHSPEHRHIKYLLKRISMLHSYFKKMRNFARNYPFNGKSVRNN